MTPDTLRDDFISKVDFTLLASIYSGALHTAGVTSDLRQLPSPEAIVNRDLGQTNGNYNIMRESIELNFGKLIRDHPNAPVQELHTRALAKLTHEGWHAVLYREFNGFNKPMQNGFYRSGSRVLGASNEPEVFMALNEGFIDAMAIPTFNRYVQEASRTWMIPNDDLFTYEAERELVVEVMQAVASKEGVAPDDAWSELIRAAATGARPYEAEVYKRIEAALGSEFLNELASALPHDALVRELSAQARNVRAETVLPIDGIKRRK